LKVADATLNQVKAKLLADIEILKAVVPTAETEAKEAGLDLKYLKERQMWLGMFSLFCLGTGSSFLR